MKRIKVIVAGTFRYEIYQEALSHGFELIGVDVIRLILNEDRPYNKWLDIVNGRKLVSAVENYSPDIVFLYRVENILPYYIKMLKYKYPNIILMQYHNDDPFRKGLKRYIKSFNYLHYIEYTDLTYVYRPVNLEEAKSWGAKKVNLYMSHYYSVNDYIELHRNNFKYKNNAVAFLGHYEDDIRISYFNELFQRKINFHIYGPNDWNNVFIERGWPLDHLHPVVRGVEYRNTINCYSMVLAFFSTRNRDLYLSLIHI